MKRYGNLYERVVSLDNLYASYLEARKGKRKKRACFSFETNLSPNLERLHSELVDGSYRPQPYRAFLIREPKPRIIYAPAFSDVVVQHAVYRVIYPLFDARFIDTTFACRKGYGTHRASDYIQSALKCYPGDYYLLQIDIRRYFDSIDRNILLQLLARTIKDEALLDLMMEFATIPEKASGIPIGNLLSQLYAGIYLSGFDHFIKRDLKIRHYARYVDDAVLIGIPSYDRARLYLSMIQFYLWSHLELDLSRWHISPIRKGVNFCGYRTWRSKRFIRKYSLYKFTRAIKRHNLPAITSLLGHAMRTNSLSSMLNRLERSNNKQMLQIARKTKERLKRNNSE